MHFHPELMMFSQKETEKERQKKKKRMRLHNDYAPAAVYFLSLFVKAVE